MAQAPPPLPTKFPCWCRATFSWGGESKNDLGFIEGDLIECLNAGDGSWWMGRLRRDRRAVGLFPSNFVRVLEEGFNPISRATSPLPPTNQHHSTPQSSPKKSKTFRKPFQAYNEFGARPTSPKPTPKKEKVREKEKTKPIPIRLSASPSRQSSFVNDTNRADRDDGSFAAPDRQFSFIKNQSSPSRNPSQLEFSRHISPRPSFEYRSSHDYETTTPDYGNDYDYQDENAGNDGSSPPPPPPPHKSMYTASANISRAGTPDMNDRYPSLSRAQTPNANSPMPNSPGPLGQTPSPLRDAMDDVMSSLQGMSMHHGGHQHIEQQNPESIDPWSPEAFGELSRKKSARSRRRPRSSLGIASSQRGYFEDEDDDAFRNQHLGDEAFEYDQTGVMHTNGFAPKQESHVDQDARRSPRPPDELFLPDGSMGPPAVPPKEAEYQPRPLSSQGSNGSILSRTFSQRKLRSRKSAYELGRNVLERSLTYKSSATASSSGYQSLATNGTSSTDKTSHSAMSGRSAGAFSATSAGSLARRKWGSIRGRRPMSVVDTREDALLGLGENGNATRPQTPSNSSNRVSRPASRSATDGLDQSDDFGGLGGLTTPKKRKSGFFKKLVESAKTGAASARGTIAAGQIEQPRSPIKKFLPSGVPGIAGGNAARDMGLGVVKNEVDWVQVRRDVNRSNSPSRFERGDRIERCQMLDYPVVAPEDSLFEDAEGDEDMNGLPVHQPLDYQTVNLQLVDKSARFINSLPPMTNAISLAQGYLCRPYRSDVQKLRAIFTWIAEKIAWEEDFEGEVDTRRVISARRGCAEEVAVLVYEMCSAVGLHSEIIRGYLKPPEETPDGSGNIRPNHWWNAVLVDGCWRTMDCSLASPTNPKRCHYSGAGAQIAESGFFLSRPMEICYTHVPVEFEQQHICPPIAPDILLALPSACPPYFRHGIKLLDYDTSLFRLENLEFLHVQFTIASDVECVAEVETRAYSQDVDGDVFENGDTTITRALAQADWANGQKRYTVKAYLPGDEGHGILKVYAGKRGLMHSIKDNPHSLAFTLPIVHQGKNPPYEFLLRHPTPHATRHDLYVAQPQCRRLAMNNTFVFAIRQHPSSLSTAESTELGIGGSGRAISPIPFIRPSSAMSMVSSVMGSDTFSQTSSNSNGPSHAGGATTQQQKPAKLAIQAPSGKILRMMRKPDNALSAGEAGDGQIWETIIKMSERGTWRGLVLADRSARWCVFGDWECF